MDGAGLARDSVDYGVGDGAVAELRMPCRRRELRARYERPGVLPRLDGLRGLAGLVGVGLLGWLAVDGWRVVAGMLLGMHVAFFVLESAEPAEPLLWF